MNERIQQLIAQATHVVEPNDHDYRHEIFDKKLFAELILQECVNVLQDNGMWNSRVSDVLDQHFGVAQ